MKAMSISGYFGKDRGARIVFNGTRTSGIGLIADENGLVIRRDGVERQYGRQINRLFNIHLRSVPLDPEVQEDVERGQVIDPSATWRGRRPTGSKSSGAPPQSRADPKVKGTVVSVFRLPRATEVDRESCRPLLGLRLLPCRGTGRAGVLLDQPGFRAHRAHRGPACGHASGGRGWRAQLRHQGQRHALVLGPQQLRPDRQRQGGGGCPVAAPGGRPDGLGEGLRRWRVHLRDPDQQGALLLGPEPPGPARRPDPQGAGRPDPGPRHQHVAIRLDGFFHTCAIRTNQTLWCWGDNSNGQLGQANTKQSLKRQQVPGKWSTVSAGGWTTCGTKTNGTLWCWGRNLPRSARHRVVRRQVASDPGRHGRELEGGRGLVDPHLRPLRGRHGALLGPQYPRAARDR